MIREERLKTYWRNHKYLIIFGAAFLLGVGGIAWFLYEFYFTPGPNWLSVEARLALVSLWVAIIGFALAIFGAFLAVLQFQAAQRKPDLHLWMGTAGNDQLTLIRGKEWPLILENRGKGVARYVKIKTDFLMPTQVQGKPAISRVNLVRTVSAYEDYWKLVPLGSHTSATFVGQEEYVCYDEDWDELGFFQIVWTDGEELKPQYLVEYELRCEGMRPKEGTLIIKLPS